MVLAKTKVMKNAQLLSAVRGLIAEGHTVTFKVKGQSMTPFLIDGRDSVVLAPFARTDLKVGTIVLVCLPPEGQYILHRIIKVQGERFMMMGDGNCRGVECFSYADVVGVAVRVVRRGRVIACSNVWWTFFSRCWRRLRFLRRLLLAFYKRIYQRIRK